MILDRRLQVSAMQALSGAGAAPSTDVIDLGSQRLIGPGEPMWWVIAARVGLAGTAPTLDIAVQTDDAAGFASPATVLSHPQLAAAAFAAGSRIVIPMPFVNERFLRLLFTLGGTTPSATVDAWLTNQHPSTWSALPDAI
jgi:hypothetical protein